MLTSNGRFELSCSLRQLPCTCSAATPAASATTLCQILANCVTLAMYSHQPGFDTTQLAYALGCTEYVFAAVFTMEMLLKVTAMGLCLQPGTYLRSAWNVLDAFVVILGWVDIALSGEQYTWLRTVRVLRPLRTITHVNWLKVRT